MTSLRLTKHKLDDAPPPPGSPEVWSSTLFKLAIVYSFLKMVACCNVSNEAVELVGIVSFLLLTAMMASWLDASIGGRIAYYFGSTIPVITSFIICHAPTGQILGGRLLITSVPLFLCATLIPFIFFRAVLGDSLTVPSTDESSSHTTQPARLTITQLMASTMVLAFSFAVLTSGDTEKNGVIWELVPVAGAGVAAMLTGIIAWLVFASKNNVVPICIGVVLPVAIYQIAHFPIGIPISPSHLTVEILLWLVLPVAILRIVGLRLQQTETPTATKIQLKRPIHRLD